MIHYKTPDEIEAIRKSCLLVSQALGEAARIIRAGISTLTIDRVIHQFICDHGARPAFLGYKGFPHAACISVNDAVVHGLPSTYRLQEGDIVSIDCGADIEGYIGDIAYTLPVHPVSAEKMRLLKATRKALYVGIQQAVPGKRLGDISSAIQQYVEQQGFSVVRELVGHGIGRQLHEDPQVPNYGKRGNGLLLQPGLVIAIEPMINLGKRHVITDPDGWTVRTRDHSPSAHFEHTVAIGTSGPDVLTTFSYVEQVVHVFEEPNT